MLCYAPVMKKFMSNFRLTFMLGLALVMLAPLHFSTGVIPPKPKLAITVSKVLQTATETTTTTTTTTEDGAVEPEPTKPPAATYQPSSDLMIKAINPGYSLGDQPDVGELIELQNLTNTSLSLAGYSVYYINKSNNETLLFEFADGSVLAGESLLMRYARSPESDRADLKYSTTLSMSTGTIELRQKTKTVDTVCWGDKSNPDCLPSFKSGSHITAVRDFTTGEFSYPTDYQPTFDPAKPNLILPISPPTDEPTQPEQPVTRQCDRLEFSEILSYYVKDKSEQFIELYNPTDQTVQLAGCNLSYKKKLYPLLGKIPAETYFRYTPQDFTLTKNPTTSNSIELIDTDGSIVDTLTYIHGQKKSTSFARFYSAEGEEIWDLTYHPTPAAENIYQEYRSCPEGKVINPETGNCVKVATSVSKILEPCPDGKYRNPLTGRCKSSTSSTKTQKPCAEGYERNPETNSCRKIKTTNDGADYTLVPKTSSGKTQFVAFGIVALLVSLGIIYIVLQFRREIARAARKARQRIHYIFKNLIARSIRFHRNKKS